MGVQIPYSVLFVTVGHKAQRGQSVITKHGGWYTDARWFVLGMQHDDFATEPNGIMELAMWLCALLLDWV